MVCKEVEVEPVWQDITEELHRKLTPPRVRDWIELLGGSG